MCSQAVGASQNFDCVVLKADIDSLSLPLQADTTVLSCDLVSFITLESKAPSRIAASKSNKRAAVYRCNLVQKKTRQ